MALSFAFCRGAKTGDIVGDYDTRAPSVRTTQVLRKVCLSASASEVSFIVLAKRIIKCWREAFTQVKAYALEGYERGKGANSINVERPREEEPI